MDKGEQQLINDIRQIIGISRRYAYRAVNLMQVIRPTISLPTPTTVGDGWAFVGPKITFIRAHTY